ncbi:DNA-directed RNA polymerases II, IV and V subunit 3-like protein, partial [Tanacetum coccineum]
VEVVDPEAYTYDDEALKKVEVMRKPVLIEIYAKEESFIFTVESTSVVKGSQLVLNAIDILKQKLNVVCLSDKVVKTDDQFGKLGTATCFSVLRFMYNQSSRICLLCLQATPLVWKAVSL